MIIIIILDSLTIPVEVLVIATKCFLSTAYSLTLDLHHLALQISMINTSPDLGLCWEVSLYTYCNITDNNCIYYSPECLRGSFLERLSSSQRVLSREAVLFSEGPF